MSSTTTIRRRYIAVPHEPAAGPIDAPSIAALYRPGSDGAAPTCTHAVGVEQQDRARRAVAEQCLGAPADLDEQLRQRCCA